MQETQTSILLDNFDSDAQVFIGIHESELRFSFQHFFLAITSNDFLLTWHLLSLRFYLNFPIY